MPNIDYTLVIKEIAVKNILVIADPIDQEQIAFNKALNLAKLTVAKIHILLFCYESLQYINDDPTRKEVKGVVLDRTKQACENFLQKQSSNITITYEVVWEKYIEPWVRKYCKSNPCDLIIKTSHRSENFFHTPTDWQLFRKSKAPIYCVSTKNEHSDRRILVALDILTKNNAKKYLNAKLLEAAFQLSLQTNSNLYCCCAINTSSVLKDIGFVDPPNMKSITEDVKSQGAILFSDYEISSDSLFVEQGEPWRVIINYARKINADCIVIGSMGNKGIKGKIIGNTAEKVIHYTESDLLVIPPK